MDTNRFIDENLTLDDFANRTLVVCPKCKKMAQVRGAFNPERANINCTSCHYFSNKPIPLLEQSDHSTTDYFFDCEFWLQASFKNHLLWFHNYEHMRYVKRYVQADLRERNNREFFTLVEKLPPFIKAAKNRDALIKTIEKLEQRCTWKI